MIFILSICQNTKISLSVPIEITDNNLDKLNKSSKYCNDMCYITKSESGTDIILKIEKMNVLITQYVKMNMILLIIIILLKKRIIHVILKNLHLLLLYENKSY